MNTFTFGTKAETLDFLYKNRKILGAEVLRPYYFTIKSWNSDRNRLVDEVMSFSTRLNRLIVRSSARSEDSMLESMAGKYESVLCDNDRKSLINAVEFVIASYGKADDDDQVLVQEAVTDVDCAGVVFSLEPNVGGCYYVINYDDSTGSSSSITSGSGKQTKLFYWFSGSHELPEDKPLKLVCKAVSRLRDMLGMDALDIEFLFSKGKLYILQTRPLVVKADICDINKQSQVLKRTHDKIRLQNKEKPYLCGRRTIYGVMPDWNPAEMIGIHPRNLALSMYKEIITDDVWAYQRDNYGYKKLRSFPLMMDFCGFPYIDVRVSFNSFIPADLDIDIAEKLVNYYLDRLEESPEKHDKVEFDIIFSCYTFDLPKRIKVLEEYGFSEREIDTIIDSLRRLTRRISDSENGLWRKDAGKLNVLEERRDKIEKSDLSDTDKIFWLLEDCKRYGTLPFAGLARAGFVAVQLLKSMVAEGIISREENEDFMSDLQTVGSQMKSDYSSMDRETFLQKYGFLRPGTYDICSQRYDEAPDTYFNWDDNTRYEHSVPITDNFRLSLMQMQRIRDTLVEHGMGEDVLGLFAFIKGAIEGRERAKFIFTRNVSDMLKLYGNWGESLGFSREDISYADIQIIKEVYSGSVDERERLEKSIKEGKRKYEEGVGVVLPPLIVNEKQVYSFFVPDSQPNYITTKRVEGEICKEVTREANTIDGKILLIESADPGYDWIFSHKIKGFITKYGGANSHMAIRAGELSIPAVVGTGLRLYEEVSSASYVEIDAANRMVRILR